MELQWQKSSYSTQPDGDCIELATNGNKVLLRESDDPTVVTALSRAHLRALLIAADSGALDDLR
ncbi:DUF397 domain-containing protein [Streptomyces iconiensis]|uniref:DUF397 domain-containing protein n=1 Tax=Streptomyces iconiensis TaxID=1384038 RepID=A0ABT7AAK6_9ACTN|nr:DUF397 domain-containing protein [Streptomyces iconiensis]MDJ1138376.1 DUF397 domain-containing protein [Streptomyces iconiensis]